MAKTGATGLTRIINAGVYSCKGFKAAYSNEAAFRQELFAAVILLPAAIYFGETLAQQILLITSLLFVLLVELLNSAIEAVVDRISDDHHELAGRAKDMGSAAVLLSIIICAAIWIAVLIP
jgi:diacylglycerol kinase (ATP)